MTDTDKAREFPESMAGAEVSDIDLDRSSSVREGRRPGRGRGVVVLRAAAGRACAGRPTARADVGGTGAGCQFRGVPLLNSRKFSTRRLLPSTDLNPNSR